ncbi:hypothetical protein DEJ23_09930 [Curtobacterium sp. MCSS17_008]|uniref:hypothetical protein n=1 Tax=Curtobacterium sp. MCSS17_008 TaxID=2175647 RepID=UPI000DA8E003|nr:hypothetical protein [Curtobacterium sp. MCSS17_008]PZF56481.1 hypothetical protein DEJ23_09930 [Curtobacterium sp. MCSS17_008]
MVAPPEDAATGLEARPGPAPQVPAVETVTQAGAPAPAAEVASGATAAFAPAGPLPDGDVLVPDYPPQEHLLPPAPTSPTVQVPPFDTAPLPVSPTDAAVDGTLRSVQERPRVPLAPPSDPAHPAAAQPTPVQPTPVQSASLQPVPVQSAPARPAAPVVPVVGQPRFSVPGLEHVLVEGTEPEPSGPIGYRTPARFARQQAPRPTVVEPGPTPFDAVIAPPTSVTPPASTTVFPTAHTAPVGREQAPAVGDRAARTGVATPAPVADRPEAAVGGPDGGEPGLQAERRARRDRSRSRTAIGATPAAVLGAVTGVAALGLAAWWFTAPATVHATGLVLGVLALVLSGTALRHPAATWQRPAGLLGAVLGGVGTLVLLWAVASAVLPLAGVTPPDLTGTGVTPTLAP